MIKFYKLFSILFSVLLLIGSILGFYFIVNDLSKILEQSELITLIISLVFVFLIISIIQISINYLIRQDDFEKDKNTILLALLSLNVFANIVIFLKGKKIVYIKSDRKKIRTYDIVVMGIFLALYVTFDFIQSLIPTLPFFIEFSIKYIPLFFMAFISDFWKTLLVCILASIISWFMPNNADAGSIQAYIFDYFIPINAISLASLIKPNLKTKKMIILQWFIFLFIPYFIGYLSKVIAGVLYWFSGAWEGYDKWTYSIIFNSINSSFDFTLGFITIPFICKNLQFLQTK